jgi:hypothetical protein
MRLTVACLVLLGLPSGLSNAATSATTEEIEFFESRVRPVLIDHCYPCHSANADKVRGGLLLDTRDGLLEGGDYGPALVPGDPDASLLIKAIRHSDPELRMPPKGAKLEPQQIADFEDWVRLGAPDPRVASAGSSISSTLDGSLARDHWAFQRVTRPPLPEVANRAWVKNAIDAFVLAGLEANGMEPSPPADRRTWLRRVTYDVTGLPPTPAEMDAFLSDGSGEARARVVDRLLDSPRYGERWGRYWLDVARYADTKGYVFQEERRYPFAHAYRDYVIEALNNDKPYDRFLLEQLAADQLELGDDNHALAAMGFLTVGRRFLNNPHDIIDDRIDVVFRGLQGLTVSCARCHDHKFEPISTRDYYAVYGVFASSDEPDEKPVLRRPVDPDAHARFLEEKARLQAVLDEKTNEEIAKFTSQVQERRADYEQAAQQVLEGGTEDTLDKLAAERNLVVQVLRRVVESRRVVEANGGPAPSDPLDLSPDDVRRWAEVQISEATAKPRNELAELDIQHPGAPVRAMVLVDKPEPVEPVVFVRGNPGNRGPTVPRQFPGIVSGDSPGPFRIGSGRLELARAIANPENPLTARVIVNRVWLGHFGEGLVRTPSDFGVRTEAPRHRALLDYLAVWLVDNGWSLKRLHRLVLLSNTYRQATDDNPAHAYKDPTNELLWKMNRRRLDFEALRDTLLAAAGNLDLKLGGRAVDITGDNPVPRRTIYGFIDRQNLPGLFRTFDFANPDTTSPQRFTTTVPQQALYLMNSPFVVRQARELMARPELNAAEDDAARVRTLYRLIFQREPASEELQLGCSFVVAQRAQDPTRFAGPAWQYGFGAYDAAQARVTGFIPFGTFVSDRWQPAVEYPAPRFGHLALTANGGHPGPDDSLSAIRRWVAPVDGAISIEGGLEHSSDQGDGVCARIVHSAQGQLGRWEAHNTSTETVIHRVCVRLGDMVDFVIEPRESANYDSFSWTPRIRLLDADRFELPRIDWSASADFAGPAVPISKPLDAWERYAHVLLQSNELVFLD